MTKLKRGNHSWKEKTPKNNASTSQKASTKGAKTRPIVGLLELMYSQNPALRPYVEDARKDAEEYESRKPSIAGTAHKRGEKPTRVPYRM